MFFLDKFWSLTKPKYLKCEIPITQAGKINYCTVCLQVFEGQTMCGQNNKLSVAEIVCIMFWVNHILKVVGHDVQH